MQQENPFFLFNRPTTFFGSFQHIETESDEEGLFSPLVNVDLKYPIASKTELYLHWFDVY